MNTNDCGELTPAALLALRDLAGAVKAITERLRVKEMGPVDHIRAKHEVKALIETAGTLREAEAIIARARARRELQQTQSVVQKMTRQQRGQRMGG